MIMTFSYINRQRIHVRIHANSSVIVMHKMAMESEERKWLHSLQLVWQGMADTPWSSCLYWAGSDWHWKEVGRVESQSTGELSDQERKVRRIERECVAFQWCPSSHSRACQDHWCLETTTHHMSAPTRENDTHIISVGSTYYRAIAWCNCCTQKQVQVKVKSDVLEHMHHWRAERAHLVVELARFFYMYQTMHFGSKTACVLYANVTGLASSNAYHSTDRRWSVWGHYYLKFVHDKYYSNEKLTMELTRELYVAQRLYSHVS